MKYILPLIYTVLAIAVIPFAHANFPLAAPMGVPVFVLMGAILATIIVEVWVVIALLQKKALNLSSLAGVLFLTNIISFYLLTG